MDPLCFQAGCHKRQLNLALVFSVFLGILGLLLFYAVSASTVDCLERLSPKWPIMCQEGS